MASVSVHIDMRTFASSVRQRFKGAIIESVSKPGIKTQIYRVLYENSMTKVPKDTGALRESPLQNGGISGPLYSKRKQYANLPHYAHGDITDEGIMYDPYTVDKNGFEQHYASSVEKFMPYAYLYDKRVNSRAYPEIAQILVKEMSK